MNKLFFSLVLLSFSSLADIAPPQPSLQPLNTTPILENKYVSVQRYLANLEASIKQDTQWVMYENNNESLWAKVRQSLENKLYQEWRNGSLLGTSPDHAYFAK